MQGAILMAQFFLVLAVFLPFVSDKILELNGIAIGFEGWGGSILGPVLTLVFCELFKIITYYQMKRRSNRITQRQQDEESNRSTRLAMESLHKKHDQILKELAERNVYNDEKNETVVGRVISRHSTNKAA